MAILLKGGGIFLHIPKTGGNWVAELLEVNNLVFAYFGEKHANLEQINSFERWFRLSQKYAKPNKPFTKFCFVRNPFSWYESWFKMQCQLNWPRWGSEPDVWHPNAALNGLGSQDFNEFISNILKRCPGYVTQLYSWYTLPAIDFIGRQERLADDLIKILETLGADFDDDAIRKAARVNKSEEIEIEWHPDLKKEIARTEYSVFKQFGYESLLP